MKVQGSLVLVKVNEEPEEVTDFGLIIPKLQDDPPMTGEVIAKGDGLKVEKQYATASFHLKKGKALAEVITQIETLPMDEVAVGDTVLFPRYAGQEVTIDDNKYLFLRIDEILAVYVED
jgi:chaperonin GroES